MNKVKAAFSSSLTWIGVVMFLLLIMGFVFLRIEERNQIEEEAALTESIFDEDDFTIEEYIYVNEYSYNVYLLVVTNNSEYTVDLECNTTAYDSDGNGVSVVYNRIKAVDPGNSGCMVFDFESPYAQSFEYTLYYEESSTPSGVDILATSAVSDGNSVTVTCEDIGSATLKYTRADILYLNAGIVVGYDYSYIYESNEEASIPSGSSAEHTFEFNEDFDDYIIYYTCQY